MKGQKSEANSTNREELEGKFEHLKERYTILRHLVNEDSGKTLIQKISPIFVLILCIVIIVVYLQKWYIE